VLRRDGALAALLAAALGCATPEPILYPNAVLEERGQDQVDVDTDACSELAEKYEAGPGAGQAGEIAGGAAEDAAAGGAAGAAGGAVWGGDAGRGAAAGAAAGVAGGIVRGIFRRRRDPDPAYRRFMERCLSDRGYEVIGWR
jgi:outer membrane lipoprotein SlyB